MENLKFTIEDREIAELLGRQNFSTKESAIFELVKNSYDAGSKICNVYIKDNSIIIIDLGNGMNDSDIKKHWMHVGKSNKGYKDENNNRILAGSKGVGRFALARLGNKAKVITKKENHNSIIWETDWITSNLKENTDYFKKGTYIEILDLRDKWRQKDVDSLVGFLQRVYKSEEMQVFVHFKEAQPYSIKSLFNGLKMGINYASKISLNYDSKKMQLTVNTESDEFIPDIVEIVDLTFATYYKEKFNMENELDFTKKTEDSQYYLTELGDFSATFYFSLEKQTKEIADKFMYKYNGLDSLKTGISLFRNDFSSSSFDGQKDWLEIASRARKSPAAATHPTGSWRVRLSQLSGFVLIDKKRNVNLKDMGNRQGLEEDDFYSLFKEILQFGISRFEKYRQSIIRKIDEKNKIEFPNPDEKIKIKAFLKNPSTIIQMSKQEIASLAKEIVDVQREAQEQSNVLKESEQKHKYDVRILNVLATQGLRASSIAHELQNKRNALSSGFKDIVSALEEYGYWEELNSDEYTRVAYKNVPKTLKNLEEINLKLMAFLDVILNKIEKNKFNSKIESIESVITKIVDVWKQQYNWIYFEINIHNEILKKHKFSDDVLEVIFDNLILNSIQHNEMRGNLIIKIDVEVDEKLIIVKYADNGIGLHSKYKNHPKRILDVHETSRQEGHGLGMWIINNTLHMYDGKIDEISSENGFSILFTLKG